MKHYENAIEEEMSATKKQTLKVLMIGLLTSFLILLSYVIYWFFFKESLLTSKSSPSGENEVVINEYGNGIVGGSDTVKIYFKQDGKTRNIKKVDVSLMPSNHKEMYHIVWLDENRVSISILLENASKGLNYNYSTQTLEFQ